MRRHGLQKPYNAMQMATWFLLPFLIVQFLFFVSPILPLGASIPVTVAFVVLGGLSAYHAYLCCVTDPIDARLERHLCRQRAQRNGGGGGGAAPDGGGFVDEEAPSNGRRQPKTKQADRGINPVKVFLAMTRGSSASSRDLRADPTANQDEDDLDDDDDDEHTKFCWVCQTRVEPSSMHCKYCDKCVGNFDHHCQWLNTCVGSANYEYFYLTVVYTFLFVLVHVACLAGLTASYFIQVNRDDGGGVERRSDDWFGADAALAVAGVNIFFLLFNLVSLSLIAQLLLFHIGLRREGITTYEYIVRDNTRKRDKARERLEWRNKRAVRIGDARREGRSGDECRLVMGGWPVVGHTLCAPCDPLRTEMAKKKGEEEEKERAADAVGEARAGETEEQEAGDSDGGDSEVAEDENDVPVRSGRESVDSNVPAGADLHQEATNGDGNHSKDIRLESVSGKDEEAAPLQVAMSSRSSSDALKQGREEEVTDSDGDGIEFIPIEQTREKSAVARGD